MNQDLLRWLEVDSAELLEIPMKGKHLPRIDLSIQNVRETGSRIFERDELFRYVAQRMRQTAAPLLWGGYLEQRLIYASSTIFHQEKHPRNIHLGIDCWAAADTSVFAPIDGHVHSFQDNAAYRDYGPTIILRHEAQGVTFHTLYGHLSRGSLTGLSIGMEFRKGQHLGWLGDEAENGEWPPHLHFQIIQDMGDYHGDYPGVTSLENLAYFQANCPDPRFLLGI